jgi:alpha-mannosidase
MKRNLASITIFILIELTLYPLCFAQDKDSGASDSDTVVPTRIKEVFLIPMTHLDVGFTDSLDVVAMKYKDNIDQAIQLCERYEEFNWTIESIWQLEQWMLRSTVKEIDRLKKLIDSQRIEVAAMYCTMRSGLLGMEDANRLMYPMQRMQEKLGIPFDTVIQDDVPGYVDVYPRVFASAGIKYFLTGINTGHGGGAYIPRNRQPFLWKSSDGQSVLTWIDHDGYVGIWPWGIYNTWKPSQGALPDDGKLFREAISNLESNGYPYSVFLITAALGDNRQPMDYIPLIEGVKEWNKSGHKPIIRFATPRQFFMEIEQQQGDRKFPVFAGNWHGLWDARLWNPAGNILGRSAQQLLPVAEALAAFNALNDVGTYYQYDLIQGYMSLYLHCEHTCAGDPSWIGIFNPTLFKKTPLRQNELTIRFAKDAQSTADRIVSVSLSELAKHLNTTTAGILIFNPLQWSRNAVVSCSIPLSLKNTGFSLRDPFSNEDLSFTLEDNGSEIVFPATNLPVFGYKWYSLEKADEKGTNANKGITRIWDHTMQNRFYRVECDPESGYITSLVDLGTGRELVNKKSPQPMNSLIITGHLDVMKSGDGELFKTACLIYKEEGSFFKRITIERKGSLWPKTTITLPLDRKRIDIQHTLDRNKFPDVSLERHSDYYSFAFPFELKDSALQVFIDGPDGFYAYPEDYLPGAPLGAVQSQYGIHLQEGNQFGVTIANRQAFNWTVGEINFYRKATHIGEPPLRILSNPGYVKAQSVYPLTSKVFSNVVQFATEGWTADFGRTYIRETEPGTDDLMVFEYFITTNQGPFSSASTTRFCREAVISPVAIYCNERTTGIRGATSLTCDDFIQIEPDNVLVTAFKKAEFGSTQDFILRLKEVDGRESQVRIKFNLPVISATLCSLNEIQKDSAKVLPVQPITLQLPPSSVATLRLRFKER